MQHYGLPGQSISQQSSAVGQQSMLQSSSCSLPRHQQPMVPLPPQQQQQSLPPPVCMSQPANPIHVQKLHRILDLNPFLNQLECLMSSSIKVPADISFVANRPQNVFSVKGIWESDDDRKKDVSSFYNFGTIKKRKWLKAILLEESDSDSDGEQSIDEQDLKALLKIHRCRRKYQKLYHADILNSQYTYYGAGLLSDQDKFPDHQKFVQEQYGFGAIPPDALAEAHNVDAKIQEAVSDVVESMYWHDSQAPAVEAAVRGPMQLVASVVDSAHQDAQPPAPAPKKKKANPPKNLTEGKTRDSVCINLPSISSSTSTLANVENFGRNFGNIE